MDANEAAHHHSHDETPVGVQEFWDDRYQEKPKIWSGKVNPVLAGEVDDLAPGRALDLGCGEGGDAIWLAQRGWTVTAVDVSEVALERAAAAAAEAGFAGITWEHHDFGTSFPTGSFDLVSAQFLQSPVELDRIRALQQGAALVAVGGSILSVSHAAAPPWAGPQMREHRFPTPEEELAALALDPSAWDVVFCGVVEREGRSPDGDVGMLLDGVIRARRTAAG